MSDTPSPGVIEVHLRELSQLFDSLDPSPFFEKDLDPKAEEYIVDSLRQLPPGAANTLLIHLDESARPSESEDAIGKSIREHFSRRAGHCRRQLHQLLRRGLISLVIGIVFLALVLAASEGIGKMLGDGTLTQLIHQGLIIIGWVAMWRPLEIFLYDWWPILGERRLHEALSNIPVRIALRSTAAQPA